MRFIGLILLSFIMLCANETIFFIKPPYKANFPHNNAKYFTNEGFRAISFGSKKIARDLFYKACVLGDDLGCVALNNINANLKVESTVIAKSECDLGDKDACFKLYKYYSTETMLDDFKAQWYLSKSCRLGNSEACNIELSNVKPFIHNERQLLNEQCFYNDAFSCYKLANIYIFGKGVVKNAEFAKTLLKKSCENGLQKACVKYIEILSFN
ncbi:hypothetical protein CCY99_09185 [Helicobacter sp. 16-1353]|uniref:tetratricopeptide repeat protein n=1 Tax=Helicobacter sp. 16-1353 TaxID=2004996 RepID=UPI000DCF2F4C|nr:sel1 repeat family protein [Helicobacter sp. 16-1353]RAX51376.1 hypothetical protein CCY99_09185 [Helicobacter sp. 16-1353]